MLLFGSVDVSIAQDRYLVNGKVLVENDDFSGVKIVLTEGKSSTSPDVSGVGIFSTTLDWNRRYFFKFSKPGYVSKIVEFSTFVPDDRLHKIEPFYMTVRLFPVFDGVDTIFFKKPVAKVYYDKKLKDFTDDRDYALKVVYQIKQMRKKAGEKDRVKSNSPLADASGSQEVVEDKTAEGAEGKNKHIGNLVDSRMPETNNSESADKKQEHKLPALKKNYPTGRTVETFNVDDKVITRVIIRSAGKQDVFYRVKHSWGGIFYFIDESPLGFFSVTENSFRRYTNLPGPDGSDPQNLKVRAIR